MIRIVVCQGKLTSSPEELEKVLEELPESADFLVTAELSCNLSGGNPSENESVKAISEIAKKHKINMILGGYVLKKLDGSSYWCALYITKTGEIYCRQKVVDVDECSPSSLESNPCVFPSEFGKIGVLICVEIEDHVLLESCLKEDPKILFNPALITPPKGLRSGLPNFKVSSESMSGKLEKYALDKDMFIVRVDHPYPIGMGTTQVVCPDNTFYFPSYEETMMSYDINMERTTGFQDALSLRPPYTIRSYFLDNTGNRYRTHSFNNLRKPFLGMKLYDPMMTLLCRSESSIEVVNFNTLSVKSTLKFRNEKFPSSSHLLASRKDNFIGIVGKNHLLGFDARRGSIILDESIEEGMEISNFLIDGRFVGKINGSNSLSFYDRLDLKKDHTIELGMGKSPFCPFQVFSDPSSPSLLHVLSDKKVVHEYDMRSTKKPVFTFNNPHDVSNIRYFNNSLCFSDVHGNLFMKNNSDNSVENVIKEYEHGIRDFIIFRNNCPRLLVVDDRNGIMKIMKDLRFPGEEEGEGEGDGTCCYEFGRLELGIGNVLFDGKTKVFTRSKEIMRVTQFRQNNQNLYLGNLFK